MAIKSFFQDMVIDTPESLTKLLEQLEENPTYAFSGPAPKDADDEFIRRFMESADSD